ncbi:mucoidy inhibitor MuiA family protein [Aquirhabdus parva]|uniref:Mucoidy inhibitor MuiA family protein n=2 Tax=Aquirhabdus parva TaxID=2283318 RepID=A0A345P8E8_9GAMM|nr:mucoidy inhibitor MuiA family protein [Aquirhabdus parva]
MDMPKPLSSLILKRAIAPHLPSSSCLVLLLGLPLVAEASSHLTAVTVYPGTATVQRAMTVDAGTKTVIFDCLPAGLDPQSLQITADTGVSIGEMTVDTQDRSLSTTCAAHPLDARIDALQDQKAALQAESDSLDTVKGYLKSYTYDPDHPWKVRSKSENITATIDALRRSGQDNNVRQYQLDKKIENLDKQLQPLIAERDRTQKHDKVTTVKATLYTARNAEIRLNYLVHGPNWSPAYRASLDTSTGKLNIERRAMVSQSTGEDWSGVNLTLSTGQPHANASSPIPRQWGVDILPPPQPQRRFAAASSAFEYGPPAPAPIATPQLTEDIPIRQSGSAMQPNYTPEVVNYGYTTAFNIPGNIDVPSNGERIAFSFGQIDQMAKIVARTSPLLDANAYLVAEIAPPEGIWPEGPMQLYRDGAFVGSTNFNVDQTDKQDLPFGRDELVRVLSEPVRDTQSVAGFTGSRHERQVVHGYVVENKHNQSITLQVFEAAPVALDSNIHITSQFEPTPTKQNWNKQQGLTLWSTELGANKKTRFAANYTISSPKDARVIER